MVFLLVAVAYALWRGDTTPFSSPANILTGLPIVVAVIAVIRWPFLQDAHAGAAGDAEPRPRGRAEAIRILPGSCSSASSSCWELVDVPGPRQPERPSDPELHGRRVRPLRLLLKAVASSAGSGSARPSSGPAHERDLRTRDARDRGAGPS